MNFKKALGIHNLPMQIDMCNLKYKSRLIICYLLSVYFWRCIIMLKYNSHGVSVIFIGFSRIFVDFLYLQNSAKNKQLQKIPVIP